MKKLTLLVSICLLVLAGTAGAVTPIWSNSLESDATSTVDGGEIVNGPATYVSGAIGNAFAGNGSVYAQWDNATLATLFDSVWNNAAGSTVDLFFSGDHWDTHSGDSGFWSVTDRFDGPDGYIMLTVRDGKLRLLYKDSYSSADATQYLTDVPLENNVIYRLTVCQKDTSFEVYLDGGTYSNTAPIYTAVTTQTISFPAFNNFGGNRYMCVGNRAVFGGVLQAGEWVDEIRVFNGYYTPAQIPVAAMDKCSQPDPADGSENVSLYTDLSWRLPRAVTDANTLDPNLLQVSVYIDTDSDFTGITPITTVSYTPDGLRGSVTNAQIGGLLDVGPYYWRVDVVDPNEGGNPQPYPGDIWMFSSGVPLPELVSPSDGTGGYGLELLLEWNSDNSSGLIVKHRIILNNITDGTTRSTEKLAVQEDYYLGNPDMWDIVFYGKDYTWQVLELGAGDEILAIGPEWSFSTFALQCTGLSVWGDLTGDCKVDLEDLGIIAQSWLECGWQLPPDGSPIQYPEKDPCLW